MPKARVQEGETLLVDKTKLPARYIEVPEKVVDKVLARPKEKKPLSEKQQANLQRLIEMNKRRREEKLAQMRVNVDELGEIPEDKVVIKVVKSKGGRPVGSKTRPKEAEDHEVVELPAKKPVLKREKKQVPRRPLSPPPSETEEEKEPVRKPRNPVGRAQAKKLEKAGKIVAGTRSVVRKPRYVSETSETETQADDEDSDESDYEEERVKKYVAKTKSRMEALKQIESQLKPQNKYQGMSIF
jgi:hypothetical protein